MAIVIKPITVEVSKPNVFQAIAAKQNDSNSRFLKVTFVNEGEKIYVTPSARVTINAERNDGQSNSYFGTVNDDGTAIVPIHSWFLELPGYVNCDVSIIEADSKLTSTTFTLLVEEASHGDGAVSEDPQANALGELIKEVEALETGMNDIFANAIKNTASGTAISLTDISPLEHILRVKARSKNSIPYPYVDTPKETNVITYTDNGITYTDNGDGIITANGTATGGSMFTLSNSVVVKKGMSISGSPDGSHPNTFEIQVYKSGDEMISTNGYESSTATVDFVGGARIRIRNGYTANNLVFKPQVAEFESPYTPYIADLSTVTLQSFEKNLYDNSTIANKLDTTAPESSYKKYKIILPNGTYTWSLQENTFFGTGHYLLFTDYKEFDGTPAPTNYISSWIGHNGSESLCQKRDTFEVTRGYVYLSSTAPLDFLTEITDKLSTMQIESGTEATPFEPYTEPTTYRINPNGTVDGVTSVYPTTTLIPDTEGVVIDAEYNVDTQKYIDNKFAKLAALIVNS